MKNLWQNKELIAYWLKNNIPQKMNFKIGGVPEHFNFPWRLALEERAFDDLGLALHWSDMSGGTGQMIKGLETGTLDIAVLLTEGITRAILQGTKAKIMDVYVTSPLQWGIHAPLHSEPSILHSETPPKFAVSRYGSGSHLMAYVLGKEKHWATDGISFNVVGDVYGGIWALENHEADLFLWEKYTTQPFVDKGSCQRLGQVDTPWPCFVIACREEIYSQHRVLLEDMMRVVKKYAQRVKESPNSSETLAWRYHLKPTEVAQWLKETEWNLQEVSLPTTIKSAVDFLTEAQLITPQQHQQWEEKLF
jgi:ABC-type nitrate/sulfonate/bicarbonate transport system substrate-binding protein